MDYDDSNSVCSNNQFSGFSTSFPSYDVILVRQGRCRAGYSFTKALRAVPSGAVTWRM